MLSKFEEMLVWVELKTLLVIKSKEVKVIIDNQVCASWSLKKTKGDIHNSNQWCVCGCVIINESFVIDGLLCIV